MGTITRSFANLITASGPSSVSALTTLTANNIQFPSTRHCTLHGFYPFQVQLTFEDAYLKWL
jgi:hypothetical protein